PMSSASNVKQKRIQWLNDQQKNQQQYWPCSISSFHSEATNCILIYKFDGLPVLCNIDVTKTVQHIKNSNLTDDRYCAISTIQCLQRMLANLLLFPWKTQLNSISCYSGFAVHSLFKLPGYSRLLEAMGYSLMDDGSEFHLRKRPDDSQHRLQELQLLLIDLVAAELSIIQSPSRCQSTLTADSNHQYNPGVTSSTGVTASANKTFSFGRGSGMALSKTMTLSSDYRPKPGCVGRVCNTCKRINSIRTGFGRGAINSSDPPRCTSCSDVLPVSDNNTASLSTYL
ncbi:hypothetical protein BOX15_Mlig019694g1, partial [Macrostomum lignano]